MLVVTALVVGLSIAVPPVLITSGCIILLTLATIDGQVQYLNTLATLVGRCVMLVVTALVVGLSIMIPIELITSGCIILLMLAMVDSQVEYFQALAALLGDSSCLCLQVLCELLGMINAAIWIIIIDGNHWYTAFNNRIDICPKQIIIIKELNLVNLTVIAIE